MEMMMKIKTIITTMMMNMEMMRTTKMMTSTITIMMAKTRMNTIIMNNKLQYRKIETLMTTFKN